MKRVLVALVLALSALGFIGTAAGASVSAHDCSNVRVLVPGTHLVFRWHEVAVKVHGRVEHRREHVWRREVKTVHRKRVVRLVPAKVRVRYMRVETFQHCTAVVSPVATAAAIVAPAAAPAAAAVAAPATPTPVVPGPPIPVALDPVCVQSAANPLAESCYFSVTDVGGTALTGGVLSFATTMTPGDQGAALAVPATSGCQVNVSTTVTSSTCVVDYPAPGTYYVDTLYGGSTTANSAGQVEAIAVAPYATTTTAQVTTSQLTTGHTSTYTAVASGATTDANGNVVSPAAAGLSFVVTLGSASGSATFTTDATGQTSCDLAVTTLDDGTSSATTVTSSDCTGAGLTTADNGVASDLTVVASFAGITGWSASTSAPASSSPLAPYVPITTNVVWSLNALYASTIIAGAPAGSATFIVQNSDPMPTGGTITITSSATGYSCTEVLTAGPQTGCLLNLDNTPITQGIMEYTYTGFTATDVQGDQTIYAPIEPPPYRGYAMEAYGGSGTDFIGSAVTTP